MIKKKTKLKIKEFDYVFICNLIISFCKNLTNELDDWFYKPNFTKIDWDLILFKSIAQMFRKPFYVYYFRLFCLS